MVYVITLIAFALCLGFIFLYSLIQLSLVISYIKNRRAKHLTNDQESENLPFVTVQLPVYNEMYVVERLLRTVSELDYPKGRMEIQLLDDSTDHTVHIARGIIEDLKKSGFDVSHIQRTDRTGYKAGALKYGTDIARGEFIAIFDADFLPNKDFLKRSIKKFADDKVGVVQSRWTYTNENYSLLTKMQAFGLNAHFTVEQVGRNSQNHFINFNGTAGVWRKKCISDAGGWEADTLTEDLDLSYRAQLKGWKFIYLSDLESPSELPMEMNALKAQQFRWNKGAASCVRKNLGKVWKSKGLSLYSKLHATFHLMNSTIFLAILFMSLLTIPVIVIKPNFPEYKFIFQLSGILAISWGILALFYLTSYLNSKSKDENPLNFVWKFPMFLSISMGLALHNALAVFEGYIGKKSPFVRTPKYNIEENKGWAKNIYNVRKMSPLTALEGGMFFYSVYAFLQAIAYNDFGILPLTVFLMFGYGFVFISSIFHWNKAQKANTFKMTPTQVINHE